MEIAEKEYNLKRLDIPEAYKDSVVQFLHLKSKRIKE